MIASQYIYKDDIEKSRLVRTSDDWWVVEWKRNIEDDTWMPFLCGTSDFLMLTDQEKEYAIDKRKLQ
jgi:hypothetical protein